ncbi:nucleoporin complex subunit 54-domain-containing protein [Phanerochaete sordida]|uniref:Nucleoporin complex subunit 54-domain-containing protein n=1 Tax=Phanerochaete sordida TaxID=48140 RepID=A0A9P3GBK9_9APHY|nr:nucleoporin complex subunit 54-domain-containing protein [Phanerochaete sordida]
MFGNFGTNNQANTGGGLFGNANQGQQQQQPQQQPAAGGLFGSTPAAGQQNTAGGGLFGATNTQNTTGGGLFGGAAQPAQPGGGLFGSTNTQQQPAGGGLFGGGQQQQQNAGGGLFGNAGATNTTNTTGTAPAGGLFGSTTAQPAAGGGLFGNTQANASGATGGGLFGNTQANTSGATGGGLFGSTSNTTGATGGGLFGSTQQNTANTTGGGLFGSTANTSTNTGGGLFGNMSTTGTTPGLFGNNAQSNTGGLFGQNQQKPAGSLFGTPASQPAGGSLFGQSSTQQNQPATNSLFGQATQQQQLQGSLFSNFSQPSGGLFGGSTLGMSTLGGTTLGASSLGGGLLASRATGIPVQQQQDPQSQFAALAQRIEGVKQAWDPSSPQCRFQHYFYNLVDPAQVHMYGRPANATNDALWQKAVRENPDPSCMVPVLAVGFDDLQQRVDAQTRASAQHQEKLKELKTRLEALSQRHAVTNLARLRRAQALQTQLTHRVLRLSQHLHLLVPALRSSSIRPAEEALRAALEELDEDVRRPGALGKMRAKLNELWALVDAVRAARERDRQEGAVEWAVVDEDGLARIAQVLAEEQAGLAHVTNILQRDLKDLGVILGMPAKEEETGPDALTGSATALRGSLMR